MSQVKDFIIAFCTACVFSGGIGLLCPKDSMSKSVRYALSLFMIFCLLAVAIPIGNLNFEFEKPFANKDSSDMSVAAAEQTFAQALRAENINFTKISVIADNSREDGINISEVTVYSSDSAERITDIIGSENYTVRVKNE